MGVWLLEEDAGVTPDDYEVCRRFVDLSLQARLCHLRLQMLLNFQGEKELRYAYGPSLHYVTHVSGVTGPHRHAFASRLTTWVLSSSHCPTPQVFTILSRGI